MKSKNTQAIFETIIQSQVKQIDVLTDQLADYRRRLNDCYEIIQDMQNQIAKLKNEEHKSDRHNRDVWDSIVTSIVDTIMGELEDDEED